MKKCNVVFHLAALIGIPYSYISPLAYLKTNLEGTYNILESAKNLETNQVIITSTSETYGTAKYVPIDEIKDPHEKKERLRKEQYDVVKSMCASIRKQTHKFDLDQNS